MPLKSNQPTVAELADMCLQYLAKNPDQLAEFMVQSGIDPKGLRRLVGTHQFAHGLIDYVVANETLLVAVASENGLRPETITRTWASHHHHEH